MDDGVEGAPNKHIKMDTAERSESLEQSLVHVSAEPTNDASKYVTLPVMPSSPTHAEEQDQKKKSATCGERLSATQIRRSRIVRVFAAQAWGQRARWA